MVRRTTDNNLFIKILYWGPHKAGKTTILETLYKLTKDQDKSIIPEGDITKIQRAGGTTLYFDRVVFADSLEQSPKLLKVFYHIYTVAGAKRFDPIRKKVYRGTDGVILVFDSQKSRMKENIESLKELIEITKGNLITNIPLIVMLNKQDLPDTLSSTEVEQILKDEGLMFKPENPLFIWNPVIFDSIGLYDKQKNVYEAFMECAQRIKIYLEDKKTTKTARINLTLTEELKNEWETFAKNILNTSLSQMIRDAVREYQNKFEISNEVPENIETKIEKIISEKMEKIMKRYKLRDDEVEK